MIRIEDRTECSGCSACYSVCPHGAITMKPDKLGFRYPEVDREKCTGCGLCDNVCAFRKQESLSMPVKCLAVRNRDLESLMESRSGGVFPVLADHVFSKGGTVYGAAFDDGFMVAHKRAGTSQDADSFRGSKYVQSDMGDVFELVRNDLDSGLHVLFSGTPCQVDGLRNFIPERLRERLILADIVCHGVPSPYVWRDYLEYQEKIHGGRIQEVSFRDKKTFGWAAHKETFLIDGVMYPETSFTHLFYRHIMLRPSCGSCPYADVRRSSDITLADFWGWQKTVPDFNADDRGVSLVLVNTERGAEMLEACSAFLDMREVVLEDCMQPNLRQPSVLDKQSERFADDFAGKGIEYVLKRYGDKGWRYTVYTLYMDTKRRLKKWLRRK